MEKRGAFFWKPNALAIQMTSYSTCESRDSPYQERLAISAMMAKGYGSIRSDCTEETSTTESSYGSLSLHQIPEGNDEEKSLSIWFAELIFTGLGFESNPLTVSLDKTSSNSSFDVSTARRNVSAADLRLSMLSNFSTGYNVISISLALRMMSCIHRDLTPAESSLCSSALVAGMIAGQLVGGVLGDVLGRHRAITTVMALQIVSALGSASSFGISEHITIFQVLAAWRFVLGLGCGGVYPLAATLSAESEALSPRDRAKAVALTFSFQGVSYCCVPLVSWVLVAILGESSDATWRLLLGSGAIPGAWLAAVRMRSTQNLQQRLSDGALTGLIKSSSSLDMKEQQQARGGPISLLNAVVMEPQLIQKFLGTGGCWFLFDVLFYGNTLFQPMVLSRAFGESETVQHSARDTLIIAMLGLLGYYVSVLAVGRQSPKRIQLQGFFAMGILYLCIGVLFDILAKVRLVLLLVYGSSFFFSNYGPNATTFMLPSMTFSRACRSTLNGISAASGKAGALLGATVFMSASKRYGHYVVFLACSVVAFVGFFLTFICVSDTAGIQEDSVIERSCRSTLSHSQAANGTNELLREQEGVKTEVGDTEAQEMMIVDLEVRMNVVDHSVP